MEFLDGRVVADQEVVMVVAVLTKSRMINRNSGLFWFVSRKKSNGFPF